MYMFRDRSLITGSGRGSTKQEGVGKFVFFSHAEGRGHIRF